MLPSPRSSGSISADDFATFFSQRVNLIRAAAASALAPVLNTCTSTSSMLLFEPVTTYVRRILRPVPVKHCSLDPVPSWLVKKFAEDIIPVIYHLCNTSLVRPRLKEPTLDASELNSHRQISNLSFLSKLMEHIVMARYTTHAERLLLFPERQSAYRHFHSTETVVTSVLIDATRTADEGKVTCLVLLDLSMAFDMVNHDILLDVLQQQFLVNAPALKWFRFYLTGHTQVFCIVPVLAGVVIPAPHILQACVLAHIHASCAGETLPALMNSVNSAKSVTHFGLFLFP